MSDNKNCYLCGKSGANSKDHIPPKNIFLEKTSDLITVPAHIECNKESEKDDEYFLFFLSIAAFAESSKMRTLWREKILRSINRPEAQGYRNYIKNHIYPINLLSKYEITDSREIFCAEVDRINRVLSKTAKGIIYKEDGTFIAPFSDIDVQLMNPEVRSLRGKNLTSVGGDIFQYSWHKKEHAFYLRFIFYKCVDIWITITCKKGQPFISS